MDKNTILSGSRVPLGYGVDGKEIMLLDDNGNKVGFNHIAEIAVKSRYLSPGYWRRPDLTAMAFSAGSETDQRVYRTGNLGYMEPEGRLEHHGRKDFLVKIRGHRIETQEIELALLDHPGVKEAAVVAHERHSQQNLVAYWAPRRYPPPTVAELRRLLNERLPDYMVPSVFLMLEALPLHPNGKLDRRALSEPSWSRAEQDACFVAPRSPVEEELARIWADVLELDQVGIYDDFFELGGHSLLASQIASRVSRPFQVELPMRSFFETTNVARLAEIVTQTLAEKLKPEQVGQLLASIESLSEAEAQEFLVEGCTHEITNTRK